MKKRFTALIAALLIAAPSMAIGASAQSYSVTSEAALLKYTSQAVSGDTVYVGSATATSSSFSINSGVTFQTDEYSAGGVTISGGATVTNDGKITSGALALGSPARIVNRGALELNSIPAGSTVDNYGSLVALQGMRLNGTLILEKGSTLAYSRTPSSTADSTIVMGLGARLKSSIPRRFDIRLPDGSSVYLYGDFDYTVQKTATPVVTLGGSNAQGQRLLTISCPTPNATIYFTLDGSDPTTASAVYREPVYVNSSLEVRAVARANNTVISDISDSPSAAAPPPAASQPGPEPPADEPEQPEEEASPGRPLSAAPTASPAAGIYPCRQMIYLSAPGARIYYTTDGSEPTTSSKLYTGPFDIVSTAAVRAIAVESGRQPSETAVFRYTLTGFNIALPDYEDPAQLEAFWQPSVQQISVASGGGVTVDAGSCPYLSNSVMKALHEKGSVALTIRRDGASPIVIPAGRALSDYQSNVRVWYSLESLAALFG